ncbi:MAG: FtsX-like permease family protein [Rikenellaceae bacterium]
MVNIIAGVSLVSVAVPVAAVIILLSIFNGFGSLVEVMNSAVDADLTISAAKGRYFDAGGVDTLSLRGVDGVEALAFVSEQGVMLEYEGSESMVTLRGVSEEFCDVVRVGESMRSGEFRVQLGDLDRLVLGNSMARKLGVRGARQSAVNIYMLRESRLSSMMPMVAMEREKAYVSGAYLLDAETEERVAYTSLRLMQRLLGRAGEVSQVVLRLREGHSPKDLRHEVQSVVGEEFKVQTREELNPVLYDIIRYEKWGIVAISIMVMLIASFSLIGIVTMLIIEKRGDVATLRAMGATWSNVRSVFFMQGMLISGVGTVVGLIIGVGVTLVQQIWGVVKLPSGAFVMDAYPVDIRFMDVVGVVVVSLLIAAVLNYMVTKEMVRRGDS